MDEREANLLKTYPLAYQEVKTSKLRFIWDGLSMDLKEETLKGINSNLEYRRVVK